MISQAGGPTDGFVQHNVGGVARDEARVEIPRAEAVFMPVSTQPISRFYLKALFISMATNVLFILAFFAWKEAQPDSYSQHVLGMNVEEHNIRFSELRAIVEKLERKAALIPEDVTDSTVTPARHDRATETPHPATETQKPEVTQIRVVDSEPDDIQTSAVDPDTQTRQIRMTEAQAPAVTPRPSFGDPVESREPEIQPLPGIERCGQGYRLESGTYGPNILDSTFNKGKTFRYAFTGEEFAIPDHINSVLEISEVGEITQTERFTSMDSWRQSEMASLGASLNFFNILKIGRSTRATSVSQTLDREDTMMLKTRLVNLAYEAHSEPDLSLYTTAEFKAAVDRLPPEYYSENGTVSDETVAVFNEFFSVWGEFFVNFLQMGGEAVVEATVSNVAHLDATFSQQQVDSFAGLTLEKWMSDGGVEHAEGSGHSQVFTSVQQHARTSMYIGGGNTNAAPNLDPLTWTPQERAAWIDSIMYQPKAIAFHIMGLHSAVADPQRKQAIWDAIMAKYGSPEEQQSSVQLAIEGQNEIRSIMDSWTQEVSALDGRLDEVSALLHDPAELHQRMLPTLNGRCWLIMTWSDFCEGCDRTEKACWMNGDGEGQCWVTAGLAKDSRAVPIHLAGIPGMPSSLSGSSGWQNMMMLGLEANVDWADAIRLRFMCV